MISFHHIFSFFESTSCNWWEDFGTRFGVIANQTQWDELFDIKNSFFWGNKMTDIQKSVPALLIFYYINVPCSENNRGQVSASCAHCSSNNWAFLLRGDNSCSRMKELSLCISFENIDFISMQTIGYTHFWKALHPTPGTRFGIIANPTQSDVLFDIKNSLFGVTRWLIFKNVPPS